jgi:hypothetical protein
MVSSRSPLRNRRATFDLAGSVATAALIWRMK